MPKKSAKKTSKTSTLGVADFESALSELETLVERMEKGELSLEQALEDFQRGIELTRSCQQALKSAEQKVQILMKQPGQEELAPFDPE
ncbi:MAG: exodeoxyribonuclease VII small subunit [Gammaproteobacteria bacterium]|nr:exodeoxyribonuclease VII small subunit [Gammaproteobacteria bacterium]MDH5776794.1 exodeoxyribonuclease VII small subunit [Gammaproteobacteria bacterium]